jgi:hypothetical protein
MSDPNDKASGVPRRVALKVIGAVPMAVAAGAVEAAPPAARPPAAAAAAKAAAKAKFFTDHEWKTAGTLADIIIPRDARSGSATEAGVVEFMDEWVDYWGARIQAQTLLAADFVPVMASLGGDDAGNILNINADTVAAEIASALKAEKLILVTDVDGILRDDKSLISRVTPQEIDELIKNNVIRGGMVPKATSAVEALKDGVGSVHIISGKKRSTLLTEVFTDTGSGTMIHRDGTNGH